MRVIHYGEIDPHGVSVLHLACRLEPVYATLETVYLRVSHNLEEVTCKKCKQWVRREGRV